MRVEMIQLGCPKNLVDGEVMMGRLLAAGHEIAAGEADAVIVNTCGFINDAREESINAILEVVERKRTGAVKRLIVAGCLVQRYKNELRREIPEIDGFIPLSAAADVVHLLANPDPKIETDPDIPLYDGRLERALSTPPHLAYVKIADGCDNPCTFCSIPSFRGRLKSRPLESIVEEVRRLTGKGVKEVVLVAQDTTAYGEDRGLSDGLAKLLLALDARTETSWIRLLYGYPNRLTPGLLETMASCESVVPYLDIPLQHAHPAILKAMGRGGSGDSFLRLLGRARETIPGLAVRSAFIVGFPGERREHFRNLLEFVTAAELDHVGVFTYSSEEGTRAYGLGNPVDERTKARRRERLLEAQQAISLAKNRRRVGRVETMLVDGPCRETEHLLEGRLATQAPEIDGRVLINDGFAAPGTFTRVKITGAHPYDLIGGVVGG